MKKTSITVGQNLRNLRCEKKLTQAMLAKILRVHQAAVSRIEQDKQRLTIEDAERLAERLKMDPAEIAFPAWRMRQS